MDETKKAAGRLRAFLIFVAKCMLGAFLNFLIVILPIAAALFLTLRSLTGFFTLESGRTSNVSGYSEPQRVIVSPHAADIFRILTRDLKSWLSELKRFTS